MIQRSKTSNASLKKTYSENNWLKAYHDRLVEERINAMNRMDKSSDWIIGLTTLIILGSIYTAQQVEISKYFPMIGNFLLLNSLIIESRRYRYFKKWGYLLSIIEESMLNERSNHNEIISEINNYDFKKIRRQIMKKDYAFCRRIYRVYFIPFIIINIYGIGFVFCLDSDLILIISYYSIIWMVFILWFIGKTHLLKRNY